MARYIFSSCSQGEQILGCEYRCECWLTIGVEYVIQFFCVTLAVWQLYWVSIRVNMVLMQPILCEAGQFLTNVQIRLVWVAFSYTLFIWLLAWNPATTWSEKTSQYLSVHRRFLMFSFTIYMHLVREHCFFQRKWSFESTRLFRRIVWYKFALHKLIGWSQISLTHAKQECWFVCN